MTQNDIRRKALRTEETLYLQQAPYLRRMGRARASRTENDETADKLRDLDLLAWDESERYLSRFAEDLEDAPYVVTDLLAETASLGRTIGMEVELPPLIASLTLMRILAGGVEVYERHRPIWRAIMRSQDLDPRARPLFQRFCQEIEANKLDPSTGEETVYRRGDPMERLRDTGEEKAEASMEALLRQVLEATRGWDCRDAFAGCWEQWAELWRHLLREEELARTLARKCPTSPGNLTSINIKLVCNVAGLLKRHLEKSKRRKDMSDTRLAQLLEEAWKADSCRVAIGQTSELTKEQVGLAKGWLAMNIR